MAEKLFSQEEMNSFLKWTAFIYTPLIVVTISYFALNNSYTFSHHTQRPVVQVQLHERCYDTTTEEEVRLTILDGQQIQSQGWPNNLECNYR